MNLQDWDITVEIREDEDYETLEAEAGSKKGATAGFNYITSDRKCSRIYIKKSCPDYELYLIHELVHILLNPLDDAGIFVLEYIPSADIKAVLTIQINEALEKTNWGITKALKNTFAKERIKRRN